MLRRIRNRLAMWLSDLAYKISDPQDAALYRAMWNDAFEAKFKVVQKVTPAPAQCLDVVDPELHKLSCVDVDNERIVREIEKYVSRFEKTK